MANVLVEIYSHDQTTIKKCKVNLFHFKWPVQNYLTRVI